jgi:hypothetical protein
MAIGKRERCLRDQPRKKFRINITAGKHRDGDLAGNVDLSRH